ncbi:hypothetical protein QYE76_061915 [Lolium multiflorum]|uniref:Uncharacterized protein n=1 Tax=Lolium multiflorum TaxID=4521 RepID=A0AAD8S2R3_LOLMU|nr:hypothetical protein QYE76_061915 [Lolium multiflorum]
MREVRLAGGIDARSLPGGGAFRSSDVYNLLLISGVSLPLNNVNWDNFAPTKVRIFSGSLATATPERVLSSIA